MWFRRDLRLEDNTALILALSKPREVLPLFIFDTAILDELPPDDARVNFIYNTLQSIDQQLKSQQSGFLIKKGNPADVWKELLETYDIDTVFFNRDYEPYAINRDESVKQLLESKGVNVDSCKDQVIFEPHEVLKADGNPYTVFTPFKNKWLEAFAQKQDIVSSGTSEITGKFVPIQLEFPTIADLGFTQNPLAPPEINLQAIPAYDKLRDFPAEEATTNVGTALRFGTISIRKLVAKAHRENQVFLSELIWREFFMQILFHFPKVVDGNFKEAYDGIRWRNNPEEFKRWCEGKTGFPMVDAGMRELNQTGYMHNRVRMVVAGFLCKHLLIDWRWGEAYFAQKLFDYELSSNNGNWQWAAGTGCDAAPYFRVFNPEIQAKKFDPLNIYVRKWIPEWGTSQYPQPMVEHASARLRAIDTYKEALSTVI